jgi:hypothetical protein
MKMAQANSYIGDFIVNNIKTIVACICFAVTLYVQHQQNMVKINRLEDQLAITNAKLEAQYVKLDDMKLDKAVFEATMKQFSEMSVDIREIRDRMEDILGDYHKRETRR